MMPVRDSTPACFAPRFYHWISLNRRSTS